MSFKHHYCITTGNILSTTKSIVSDVITGVSPVKLVDAKN